MGKWHQGLASAAIKQRLVHFIIVRGLTPLISRVNIASLLHLMGHGHANCQRYTDSHK
ncbi:hypothetical protein Hfont_2747 [Herminiimonas fonticola]|nr:hypothetical protein Hfont_2747 [Herminiimonas fonticola]